jgi:phosphoenolpyruvate carboxylase
MPQAMTEVFARYGICPDFLDLDESARIELLVAELEGGRPLTPHILDLGEDTDRTLEVFRLVRRAHERLGPDAIDTYIISMTQRVSDVLTVLLLARDAGCARGWTWCPCWRPWTIWTGRHS